MPRPALVPVETAYDGAVETKNTDIGLTRRRFVQSTGALVEVWRVAGQKKSKKKIEAEREKGEYKLVCVDHGTEYYVDKRPNVLPLQSHPERWCKDCKKAYLKGERVRSRWDFSV